MKNGKFNLIGLFLVLLLVVALVACAAPASAPTPAPAPAPVKPIELRYGHHNPPTGRTTVEHLNAWAQKVETATKGKVKITMYPAESLFKAMESLEAIKGGVADVGWVAGGFFAGRFPLSSVVQLPFLCITEGRVDGRKLDAAAINSRIFQELYETVPEIQREWADFKVLYLHTSAPFFLATTKKPVRTMEDLKGLKIRDSAGPPIEMWKALGVSPMTRPVTEIYELAEKGVIDGSGLNWALIATYKLYEVFRYWTDAPTVLSFFAVVMNKEKWNSLPADVQREIMSLSGYAGAEFGGDAQFGKVVRSDAEAMAAKAGKPMERVTLAPGVYDRWVELGGKPIWDKWASDLEAKGLPGKKVLSEVLRLQKKYTQ